MKACYLIGEHLGHSFSADIHRQLGRYEYELKELFPGELGGFLNRRDFRGLNVTIPFKEAVIPYLDHLDPQAAAIGAVNTVVNRNGVLWGYNTDFGGMRASLLRLALECSQTLDERFPLHGKTVLILGTGGTSKTALALCQALGAGETLRVSRTGRDGALCYPEALVQAGGAAWIINCTPAGMYPDTWGLPFHIVGTKPRRAFDGKEAALSQNGTAACFPALEGVLDCVYNPLRTSLLQEAEACGIPAANGLYMLVKQAALSCEQFTGLPVEEAQVEKIYKNLVLTKENLVLIGMPGAGKTTVGRLLAMKTGKDYVDLDEEIVRRAGKPISAIFAEDGESYFRDLESALIAELSSQGGKVIATGGGSVLREENEFRLRQNGRLFFLDRPLEALTPTADRPLGDTREKLQALYAERYPRYLGAADYVIPNGGEAEEAVQRIMQIYRQSLPIYPCPGR